MRNLLAGVVLVAVGLSGCSEGGPGVSVDDVLRAHADASAFALCGMWLRDGGPTSSDFKLVGAMDSTAGVARTMLGRYGGDPARDSNLSNSAPSADLALCALRGPQQQFGLKGNTLVYYVVRDDPQENGLLAATNSP